MQIVIVLIVTWLISESSSVNSNELKLIQVIFRHGERAPSSGVRSVYPLDPYVNETWYPHGWNGLNKNGKKSAYELGLFLRERYGQWLGNVYLENDVQFRSSNKFRVVMSTQLVAAGLFPPSEIQRWHLELNWQPIPVYFELNSRMNIFNLCKFWCPAHKAMQSELERRDEFLQQRDRELNEFYDTVSNNVGTTVRQTEVSSIYHQLDSELSENVDLPEWTKGIFPHGKLSEIAAYDYVLQSYNQTLIKMNGGPWIQEWLKNVDKCLNSSDHGYQRGHFYGAHEATLAGILSALGMFEPPHVPFYSSAIIFELSKTNDEFYVKVLYRNRKLLREMLIPGCDDVNCPLTTFRELFHDIVSADAVALCQGV